MRGIGLLRWGLSGLLLLVCSGLASSCDDSEVSVGDEPAPPDERRHQEPKKPAGDRLGNSVFEIDESGMTTEFGDFGARITIPMSIKQEASANVRVSLTPLDSFDGPSTTVTTLLSAEQSGLVVVVPDAVVPDRQSEQGLWLVRYELTGDFETVSGARSLYETTAKYGLTIWCPASMDAGETSIVRVLVTALSEGTVVPNVPVEFDGATMLSDDEGQAVFEWTAPTTVGQHEVTTRVEVAGLTLSELRQIGIRPVGAPSVHVSTDKPLYRPGQTIHIRAMSLTTEGRIPVPDEPVTFEVRDGKANVIFREEGLTDAYGIASLTAPLASQVNVGTYSIRAIFDGATATQTVEVSEEKLPKFGVNVDFDAAYVSPGAVVTGTLSARYFFGTPVANATVTLAYAGGQTFTGQTNPEGVLPFEMAGPAFETPLSVEVVDTAGFTVQRTALLPIRQHALSVQAIPESSLRVAGVKPRVYLSTRGPLGNLIPATCSLIPATCSAGDLVVDTDGIALVELPEYAYTTFECSAVPAGGGEPLIGFAVIPLHRWRPPKSGGIVLRTDKAMYEPGETIEVTIHADIGIERLAIERLYRGRIVDSGDVVMNSGMGTWSTTVPADESGLVMLHATRANPSLGSAAQVVHRLVYVRRPAAKVTVETDAATYLPGGEAQLTFRVADEAGYGKPAAIGVTIADEAVFALAGASGGTDVEAHFLAGDAPAGLRDALGQSTDAGQLQAGAALATLPMTDAPSLRGLSEIVIAGGMMSLVRGPLYGLLKAVIDDIHLMAQRGEVHMGNYDALANLDRADFWGQPLQIVVKPYDDNRVRIRVMSSGVDEIFNTEDDRSAAGLVLLYESPEDAPGDSNDPWPTPNDVSDGEDSWAGADAVDAWDATDATDATDAWDGADCVDGADGADGTGGAEPKIRDEFPETLYVNPSLITDSDGVAQITLPLADAITAWRVSMIANTQNGHLGAGQGSITVFQEFFVDVDLPRKLTQNDELHLPIGIFNFGEESVSATVTVEAADWFEFLGNSTITVDVPAGGSVTAPVPVRVLTPGAHAIQLSATAGQLSDGVLRTVSVVPDGQLVEQSESGPLDATKTSTITIPASAIEGGNDGLLKLMGGPSAQLLDGVEALLQSPRGCFEPMMNSTWVNALVLDYLIWTDQYNKGLADQAHLNLNDGVQQSLTFECNGGGFTWFGAPSPAHPILTAFALIMFSDITTVDVAVDTDMVARARDWLVAQQGPQGSWLTTQGTKNQALPWDELRTTCIALWGLASTPETPAEALSSAVTYVTAALDDDVDTYTLAMCANALLTAAPDSVGTDVLLADLINRAESEGEHIYWDSGDPGITFASGPVVRVETTALVTQALFALQTPPASLVEGALKFLAASKQPDGNFMSTQGTIQALRAFVMAAKLASEPVDAQVTVTVGDEVLFSKAINAENKDVVNLVSLTGYLNPGDNDITIEFEGVGEIYYQLVGRHYLPWEPGSRRVGPLVDISTTYLPATFTVNESTIATIQVTTTGAEGAGPGDMPMVDFGVPPGFDADLTALDEMVKTDPIVARYEVKGERVVVYLHDIPAESDQLVFSLEVPMKPRMAMTVTTPPARTWPFYEPEKTSESIPVVLTVTE